MYVSGSSAFYKTTAARRRRVRLEITRSMYTVYIHIAATRTFATQHTRPIRLRDKCNDSFNTYVITANNNYYPKSTKAPKPLVWCHDECFERRMFAAPRGWVLLVNFWYTTTAKPLDELIYIQVNNYLLFP